MKNNFAIYESKFGQIKIVYQNEKIIFLKKVDNQKNLGVKTILTDNVYQQLVEYFSGKRKIFNFEYELIGTSFQKKVWNALLQIPYGETRSYQEIALQIGNEKAARAVGLANNKNPLTIVVPCHRVIGKNGKLVGYFGGLEMKQALLQLEKENK